MSETANNLNTPYNPNNPNNPNNPIIRTFHVPAPYYGPPQIVTPIQATLSVVYPDGCYLPRCNACSGDKAYDNIPVIWNIVVDN